MQRAITHGAVCYIHESKREELGISEGNRVEVVNPETGARVRLPVETGSDLRYQKDWVRLDRNSRTQIGVEPEQSDTESGVSRITIREPPQTTRRSPVIRGFQSISRGVGRLFVDYTTVRLQIIPGRDRDEDRSIVRLDDNTMKSLGIQEHDKAIIQWHDRKQSVRCLSVASTLNL